jgi:hypothetical protein
MPRKILMLCLTDEFANGVWASETKKVLQAKGYAVNVLDKSQGLLSTYLDNILLSKRMPKSIKGKCYYSHLKRRAQNLEVRIIRERPDAVICLDPWDSYVLTRDLRCLKIFCNPTPWIDELYFGGELNQAWYKKLRDLELEIYENTDYLSFHWENYTNYVRKNIYNGSNIFIANMGCNPKVKRAKWTSPARVVFIGFLGGFWNNLPLLARLSRQYHIDIFGAPTPGRSLGLSYKGYALTTEILADYQFGLVTISMDKLRRSGFSSKHLEYLSYGLPVLTPEWREDPLLDAISIKYNESNFLDKIGEYSNQAKWETMSERCYQQSLRWTWETQLEPLLEILEKELG